MRIVSVNLGEPGTVIRGTLRTWDLIEAFTDELYRLDTEAYDDVMQELSGLDQSNDNEDLDWFLNEVLFDKLNEYAPDGYYFGAHPGDGSDFGFWEFEE